jgi:hypothetical protein
LDQAKLRLTYCRTHGKQNNSYDKPAMQRQRTRPSAAILRLHARPSKQYILLLPSRRGPSHTRTPISRQLKKRSSLVKGNPCPGKEELYQAKTKTKKILFTCNWHP